MATEGAVLGLFKIFLRQAYLEFYCASINACYVFSTRNNCCEFLASHGVAFQSVIKTFNVTSLFRKHVIQKFWSLGWLKPLNLPLEMALSMRCRLRVASGSAISGNLEMSENFVALEKGQGISWNSEKSGNFYAKLGKVREFYLHEAEVFSRII